MRKTIYSIAASLLLFPTFASATTTLELKNPLADVGVTSIPSLADKITTFVVEMAVIVAPAMILFGAFQMLSAAGNETKYQQGKKTITYAIIGLAVILAAKGITAVVTNFLGV